MDKEFALYAEALELKELGFDEPCFRVYDTLGFVQDEKEMDKLSLEKIQSPTYSQAFRWFREKFKLHSYIEGAYPWFRYYINSHDNIWEGHKYLRHEEAELACLRKLIEILKTKQ